MDMYEGNGDCEGDHDSHSHQIWRRIRETGGERDQRQEDGKRATKSGSYVRRERYRSEVTRVIDFPDAIVPVEQEGDLYPRCAGPGGGQSGDEHTEGREHLCQGVAAAIHLIPAGFCGDGLLGRSVGETVCQVGCRGEV